MMRKATAGEGFELTWFKSSYSGGTNGESCVEIATTPGAVHVRDSKNLEGPRLALAPGAWAHFVAYAVES
ncbi:DUF397 domain-containing protein [Streptomyces sp. NPDC056987]|uniref:DUF397 domain-containing protein n=1 Tax=Streptomyces sp. NPDC056987 TaxID=3345988 RepID=UPI00362C101F